ncbi:MAG: hypothetical protein ACHQ2Z_08875 [Elusimicrobiota bacterium]
MNPLNRALLVFLAVAGAAAPAAAGGYCDRDHFVIHLLLTDVRKDTGDGAYENKDGQMTGKWVATSIEEYGFVKNTVIWEKGKSGAKEIVLAPGSDSCSENFKFDFVLDTDNATATRGDTGEQAPYSNFGGVVKGSQASAVFFEEKTGQRNDPVGTKADGKDSSAEKAKHLLVQAAPHQFPGCIVIKDPGRSAAEAETLPIKLDSQQDPCRAATTAP